MVNPLWNNLHKLMGILPFESAGREWKREVTSRSPFAIPTSFAGLSLGGKSAEAGAVPGIAFATSMKRELIGQPGDVKCRPIKERKDKQ